MLGAQTAKPKAAAKPKTTKPKAKTAAKPKKVSHQINLHLSLPALSRSGAEKVSAGAGHA